MSDLQSEHGVHSEGVGGAPQLSSTAVSALRAVRSLRAARAQGGPWGLGGQLAVVLLSVPRQRGPPSRDPERVSCQSRMDAFRSEGWCLLLVSSLLSRARCSKDPGSASFRVPHGWWDLLFRD